VERGESPFLRFPSFIRFRSKIMVKLPKSSANVLQFAVPRLVAEELNGGSRDPMTGSTHIRTY
jgi:hypothetical protein